MAQNDKLAAVLQQLILAKLEKDSLVLPAMPKGTARAIALVRTAEFDFRELATLVEREPVVAARFLRQSSAGDTGESLGLKNALVRMGARGVKNVLLSGGVSEVFVSRDSRIAEVTKRLWEHSVATALLCRDLASILGGVDAESAYMAGLIHDVGKPIVAGMLLEVERASPPRSMNMTAEIMVQTINGIHRVVGTKLAERWNLPSQIVASITDCSEYNSSDRLSLGNLVCFANAVAKVQGIYAGAVDRDDAETLIMIGRSLLSIDDSVLGQLSNNLKTRVAAEIE